MSLRKQINRYLLSEYKIEAKAQGKAGRILSLPTRMKTECIHSLKTATKMKIADNVKVIVRVLLVQHFHKKNWEGLSQHHKRKNSGKQNSIPLCPNHS